MLGVADPAASAALEPDSKGIARAFLSELGLEVYVQVRWGAGALDGIAEGARGSCTIQLPRADTSHPSEHSTCCEARPLVHAAVTYLILPQLLPLS